MYRLSEFDICSNEPLRVSVSGEGPDESVYKFVMAKCIVTKNENDIVTASDLYDYYVQFCESNNLIAISNSNTFSKWLHKLLPDISNGKKRINGKPTNVWCYLQIRQ